MRRDIVPERHFAAEALAESSESISCAVIPAAISSLPSCCTAQSTAVRRPSVTGFKATGLAFGCPGVRPPKFAERADDSLPFAIEPQSRITGLLGGRSPASMFHLRVPAQTDPIWLPWVGNHYVGADIVVVGHR